MPARSAAPSLDEAAVAAMTHRLFELIDTGDLTFVDQLGATFVWFQSQRMLDEAHLIQLVKARAERNQPRTTRTWAGNPRVLISSSAAVYIGVATSHVPGAPGQLAADDESWFTCVWVPERGGWKLAHLQSQKGGLEAMRETRNERYRKASGFKLEPNQLLVDTVTGRKPGRALDLASGQGRNLVFLAMNGWKATGVDISDVGHRVAQDAAARQHVTIETIQADLTAWDFGTKKWDLVAMIYAGHGRNTAQRAKASIRKHGLFVAEFFTADSLAARSGVGGWNPGELAQIFREGWTILKDEVVEDIADWSLTQQKLVRFVAQKL